MARLSVLGLMLIPIGLSSCFSSDLAQFSCDIPCTARCSAPLECRNGFCVLPDAPDCPERPSPAAECRAQGSLEIQLAPEPVSVRCTGEPIDLTLTVVGGSAPYVWSLSGLDDFAFDSNPSTSSTLEVSGQLTVAGRHEVGISVQAGEGEACQSSSTSFPLDVVAAPVIGIAGLEEACVGEAVVLTLSATGGDRAGDVWTVKDEALPSGLRLEGNTIVGTPSLEGAFTFEVTLESGRCQPVRRGVSLSVRAAGECPSITTDALAAPCEGIEYFAPLVASSGEPPYEWDLVEGPSWLSIDAATQTLHGLPDGTASGRVTLRVRDARQHGMSRSYAFEPRQSCYFAYVSQAAESPGLHYADVFLARDVLVSRDIPVGSQVADFEFSPDGGFIAFRAGVGNEHALYLYATASSTPAEASSVQRLPLECPLTGADAGLAACGVLDYAWSADSRHLAVVLGEPGAPENYLSGMDVAAPTSQWPALATTYRGELVWVESMAVAYSGERTPAVFVGEESPFFSFYTAEGRLSAPESLAFYASDVRLRATPTGLFFVDGSAEVYHLSLGPNGAVGVRPHARGWASPSGRYVAEANPEGQLRLYGVDDPDTVLAESEPGSCEVVFTWAEQREMIACTRSLSSAQGNPESVPPVIEGLPFSHGSGLRIFEFRPDAELAQRLISWSIPLEHYSTGDTAGRRRSFSLGGDKLVFITDFAGSERIQAISVARDATSGSSRIDRGMRQPIELAFSPRGDSYVTYEAAALIQFATPELGSFAATVTDALEGRFTAAELSGCAEEFYANPDRWCGSPGLANHFSFSPDAQSILFEDAGRALWLSDRSAPRAQARATGARLPPCVGECSDRRYAFRRLRPN